MDPAFKCDWYFLITFKHIKMLSRFMNVTPAMLSDNAIKSTLCHQVTYNLCCLGI